MSRRGDGAAAGGRAVRAPEPSGGEGAEPRPKPTVSVLVLVTERPEALDELYCEYAPALAAEDRQAEFIFVAPAWRSDELNPLHRLREEGEPVRVVEVGGEFTEAGLLRAAADRARGDVLLTLPAYYRVEPAALPELLEVVDEGETEVAVACRSPRRDPWINRMQNRVFHGLLKLLVGTAVSDAACGVRAIRPEVLDELPMYGDFYRFLPVLASREGFRVREIEAPQHERDTDPRIYPFGVYVRRVIDLLGLFFLTRFTYKPLRFFGLVGSVLGSGGLGVLVVVFLQRIAGQTAADRPLMVLGILLATLGVQAIALGLVGEIIVHFNASNRPRYRVVEDSDDES